MKKFITGIIFIFLIVCFIFLGTRDYKQAEQTDNVTFSEEYQEIDENNIFTYTNASKVLTTLRSGSGIIFFGFKKDVWAGYYANILNSAAMDLGIKEIYYYDFYEDRNNQNATYESIVELLKEYLVVLDDGTKNIYSPSIVIVKDGEIVAFNDDTAIMRGKDNPEEYWNEYQTSLEKIKLTNMINQYLGNSLEVEDERIEE